MGMGIMVELPDLLKEAAADKWNVDSQLAVADVFNQMGDMSKQLSDYRARKTDRRQGANTAGNTIKSIEKQIVVQQTLIEMATKDLANAKSTQDSLAEIENLRITNSLPLSCTVGWSPP